MKQDRGARARAAMPITVNALQLSRQDFKIKADGKLSLASDDPLPSGALSIDIDNVPAIPEQRAGARGGTLRRRRRLAESHRPAFRCADACRHSAQAREERRALYRQYHLRRAGRFHARRGAQNALQAAAPVLPPPTGSEPPAPQKQPDAPIAPAPAPDAPRRTLRPATLPPRKPRRKKPRWPIPPLKDSMYSHGRQKKAARKNRRPRAFRNGI